MYRQTKQLSTAGRVECPECGNRIMRYRWGKLTCADCGHQLKGSIGNKYGAKKTVGVDGLKRDSKFESSVADELYLRKQGKDIKGYDSQYKVSIPIYGKDGEVVHTVNHKVDFRIHHNDSSYELLEAKGVQTQDYLFRKMLLEKVWLPEHKDHTYTVVFQRKRGKQ